MLVPASTPLLTSPLIRAACQVTRVLSLASSLNCPPGNILPDPASAHLIEERLLRTHSAFISCHSVDIKT